MPASTIHTWIARIVFCVFVGAVPGAFAVGAGERDLTPYYFEIALGASAPGTLQLFYDRGNGIGVVDAAAVPLAESSAPIRYRLPLPTGTYTLFRIDPNVRPGRYTVASISVLDGHGAMVRAVPLTLLEPAYQAAVESRGTNGVVMVTAPDANDPQLIVRLPEPLHLTPPVHFHLDGFLAFFIGAVLALAACVATEWVLSGRCSGGGRAVASRPRLAITTVALAGTLLAVYPLLLGRSLVSPNNWGAAILYDQPPYTYGATDRTLEDVRGVDVGAMMWGILPYSEIQRTALTEGEWPLWNRYNAIGTPLWGQGQTYALDPLHLASLLIPDAALAMDVRFIMARWVMATGVGLVAFAVTGAFGPSALVALLTPFIGYFMMRFNHPAYFSLSYAPWVLLAYAALERTATFKGRAGAAAGLAIASWLQLVASTPKEGLVALIAVHLAGTTGLLAIREPWRDRLARLDAVAVAGIAALLASAPHWLIFLDTLSRSYTLYDKPAIQFALLQHVEGFVLGAAKPGSPFPAIHTLLAALFVAGLLLGWRRLRSGLPFGAAVATGLLWSVAFGVVPAEWLARLPFVANIYSLAFSLFSASVPIILVVAAVGAQSLRGPATALHKGAAMATLGVLGWIVVREIPAAPFSAAAVAAVYSVAGAIAFVGVAAFGRVTIAATFALVVTATAAVITGGLALNTGVPSIDSVLVQPRLRVELERRSPAIATLYPATATSSPSRVAAIGDVLFPGTQAYWGLEGIGGPDALRLPFLETLSDLSGVERTDWIWRTRLDAARLPAARGYLDMLNVQHLVWPASALPASVSALPAGDDDFIRASERSTAWPRAFFVDGVERLESVAAFAGQLSQAHRPFAAVSAQDADALEMVKTLPAQTTTVVAAEDYRLTTNTTRFTVNAPAPGVVVLSEAYVEKDFIATLNGRPVPYFRVNHALKGVPVPGPGKWDIAFEYRPARWRTSWTLALVGWVLILAMTACGVVGSQPRPPAGTIDKG